ncbi:BTB/POZ domain-containing protein 3-like isoform X1 [Dreissena polymorpha]|uniref:BTB/POZ domain-containing protein 3-like isoform X1 n=1 Tax=Dreissena polymorpha TaxID=45954 RepID=UPI00226522D2|nr:BTB/POZ domain-containing protein 3-like isoform X1 [Dreissena polymorpha]
MAGVPPEDWQSARTTVVGCNKYMLDNQLHCDVTFRRVGRGRTPIKAHSYVLMSRSCVFYDMLTMESADEHRDIETPDVEPPVFFSTSGSYKEEIGELPEVSLDKVELLPDLLLKSRAQSTSKSNIMRLNVLENGLCVMGLGVVTF